MEEKEVKELIEAQRAYYRAGKTIPVETRILALKSLENVLKRHEDAINEALKADLGKSATEGYMCELGLTYSELTYMIKHTRKFAKDRTVHTPLSQAVSHSFVKPSPRGVVLIMSPWNYPFLLTMDPLIDAIAAGNTVILKPSAYAPRTAEILQTIVAEAFPPSLVSIVTGGRAENQCLLKQKFDYIFFTGSQSVGKEVLRNAAEHLTPVALELGGKSPCIVDQTANIKLAARRIVFGKFLNCGQTCVAPDYILVHSSVAEKLEAEIVREIKRQFDTDPLENKDYGHIINEKHFLRLKSVLDQTPVSYGGRTSHCTLQIEPTVLSPVTWNDKIMEDEIFGPLLPIISYDALDAELEIIESRPHPLALYIFSCDRDVIHHVTSHLTFGGGCVNDTIIHLATTEMGFGGVGESGMGAYHGKTGFDAFSHHKSIVDKKTWLDLPMRYQPYKPIYDKLIKLFLK